MDVHDAVVAPAAWYDTCAELAGSGARMLDFLAAVDEPSAGQIEVVVHLVDVPARARHLVRTRVDREQPLLASLVTLYPGAAWHEREAHEMFGLAFAGNDDLRPLLTTGETGFPLRRTTALPTRVQTPWPGAVEPADRRSTTPPHTTPPATIPPATIPPATIPPATTPPATSPPATSGTRTAARPRSRPTPPGVHPEWQP